MIENKVFKVVLLPKVSNTNNIAMSILDYSPSLFYVLINNSPADWTVVIGRPIYD
jgi:hypothetical protein